MKINDGDLYGFFIGLLFSKSIFTIFVITTNKTNIMLPYTSSSDSIKGYKDSKLAQTETNDCVVRAIASASGWDYDKSHSFVGEVFNRKFRKGTYFFNSHMNSLSENNKRLNRKKIQIISKFKMMNGKSQMTVGKFVEIYTKGTYIICISGHAFTIKDGVVIGNWSDAKRKRARIQGCWKIGS